MSLRTKDYSTARSLKSLTETTILQQLNSFTVSNAEISFPELVDRFLKAFGLNLIKQGISIYKVSKLLGHKSVRTTEQHYAPLLTVEIEDFTL